MINSRASVFYDIFGLIPSTDKYSSSFIHCVVVRYDREIWKGNMISSRDHAKIQSLSKEWFDFKKDNSF